MMFYSYTEKNNIQLFNFLHLIYSLFEKPVIKPFEFYIQEEIGNGSVYWGNGHITDETRSLGSPYRRSHSAHDVHRRPMSDYASPEVYYSGGQFSGKCRL